MDLLPTMCKLKTIEMLQETSKFNSLNFNLTKMIFSFLSLKHKRKIYFSNKHLRELLECKDFSCFRLNKLDYCGSIDFDFNIDIWPHYLMSFYLHKISNNILCSSEKGISLLDTKELKLTKICNVKALTQCIEYDDFLFCIVDYTLVKISKCAGPYNPLFLGAKDPHLKSICKISENQFAVGYSSDKIQICSFSPFKIISEIIFKNTQISYLTCFNKRILIFSNSKTMITIIKLNKQNKKQLIKKQKSPRKFLILNNEYFACTMYLFISIFYVDKLDKVTYSHRIPTDSYLIQLDIIFEEYLMICDTLKKEIKIFDWKNKCCLKSINLLKDIDLVNVIVDSNNIIVCSGVQKIHFYKVKNCNDVKMENETELTSPYI